VQKQFDEIQRRGGSVLVATMSEPSVLAEYEKKKQFPFPLVADPKRIAYKAMGLGRGSWLAVLHPMVMLKYTIFPLLGWIPRMPKKGEDVWQLGGDFILDRQRRLKYAYVSKTPYHRPSMKTLLEALQEIDSTPAGD
jgi:peroxiredoxin